MLGFIFSFTCIISFSLHTISCDKFTIILISQMRKQMQRRKVLCPQSPLAIKREGPLPTSLFFLQVTLAAHFSRL